MSKSNRKNVEKVVTKKLNKLIKKAANAAGESRLVVMTSKDYLLVKVAKEKEGTSFIDQYLQIVRGLDNQVKMIRDYDGKDLKQVNMTPFALGTTDFAAMQGLDVDELADRDSDEPAPENPEPVSKYGEWSDKKPSRLEEYKSAPNIVDNVIGTSYYSTKCRMLEESNEALRTENTELQKRIKELEEENDTVKEDDVLEECDLDEILEPVDEPETVTTSTTDDGITRYEEFAKLSGQYRVQILPDIEDDHMFKYLDTMKEFKRRKGINTKMYTTADIINELSDMYYNLDFADIAEIFSISRYCLYKRTYTKATYALMIALAVPASYVNKFIEYLIKDYNDGLFHPIISYKWRKGDFVPVLRALYPQVIRIRTLLFKDVTKLPYLYTKTVGDEEIFYVIGTENAAWPDTLKNADDNQYVIVPESVNPYDIPRDKMVVLKHEQKRSVLNDKGAINHFYTGRMQVEEYANDKDLFPNVTIPSGYKECMKFYSDNMRLFSIVPGYSKKIKNEDLSNC